MQRNAKGRPPKKDYFDFVGAPPARDLKLVHRGKLLDPVTLSIGIAGFPDHGQTAQELLDVADKSLYQSKGNGRDRVTLASD